MNAELVERIATRLKAEAMSAERQQKSQREEAELIQAHAPVWFRQIGIGIGEFVAALNSAVVSSSTAPPVVFEMHDGRICIKAGSDAYANLTMTPAFVVTFTLGPSGMKERTVSLQFEKASSGGVNLTEPNAGRIPRRFYSPEEVSEYVIKELFPESRPV